MTVRRSTLPWLAVAVCSTLSSRSNADGPQPSPPSKQACAQAYGDGQHLRADGKLLAARQALVLCAQQSCPAAARSDCTQWLGEVTRTLSSIAVHAVDANGADVTDVRVFVDGAKVADQLTGQPLEVDPGTHTLRFERPGSTPDERPLVAVAGQKLRPLEVHFTAAPPAPAALEPQALAEPGSPTGEASPLRRVPLASWVLGGAGVAAFAVAGGLWAAAQSDYNNLNTTCSPRCNPSQASSGRTEMIVGDVAAVAGGLSLGAAVLWYFLRPAGGTSPAQSASNTLDVTVSPRAAIVGAHVAF